MKKGTAAGIAVAVVAISIVFGIASLPDEVLMESPNLENSDTEITEVPIPADIELPPTHVVEETIVETEEETMEVPEEETMEVPEEETMEVPEEEEEGKVIEISIKDGIGAGYQ